MGGGVVGPSQQFKDVEAVLCRKGHWSLVSLGRSQATAGAPGSRWPERTVSERWRRWARRRPSSRTAISWSRPTATEAVCPLPPCRRTPAVIGASSRLRDVEAVTVGSRKLNISGAVSQSSSSPTPPQGKELRLGGPGVRRDQADTSVHAGWQVGSGGNQGDGCGSSGRGQLDPSEARLELSIERALEAERLEEGLAALRSVTGIATVDRPVKIFVSLMFN